MSRTKLAWTLGVLLLALLVAAAVAWPRSKAVETVPVRRASIAQTVVATGRVNTPARIELGSEVTGTVLEVRAREGDAVKAGQVLLRLRDDEARAALAQARAALAEAQARSTQLDQVSQPVSGEAVAQAQANLRNAQAEHQRAKDLVAQGFFAQQKLDDAQRALDNARSALAAAQAQAVANRPGGVERQLALARIDQAGAALAAAQARLERMTVKAPVDALVTTRSVEPGSLAQPGRVLMVLAATGATRIDANVDEKHLDVMRTGLKARVLADAYPAQPFDAQVAWVAPAVDAQRGTVEVRLRVAQPPVFIRPDMTVSVEMQVGAADNALVVAADAVRDADSATPWALVVEGVSASRRALMLGFRGAGSVQVREGLAEGEQVIVQTAAASEGDRVHAKPRGTRSRGLEVPQGLAR